MIGYIFEFMISGDERTADGTEEWTNLIDRGGLWHVSDFTYDLFLAMENQVRLDFNMNNGSLTKQTNWKELVVGKVLENKDVKFQWWLLSVEHDSEISQRLLGKMVVLHVTARGLKNTNKAQKDVYNALNH